MSPLNIFILNFFFHNITFCVTLFQDETVFFEIKSKEGYEKFFLGLNKKGSIKEFLTRLEDFTDDNGIKKENISNLIAAIFDIADLIPNEREPMNLGFGNEILFKRIIYQLKANRSITQDEYFEMVKTAILSLTIGIDFVVSEVGYWWSYYTNENDRNYPPPFTKEQSEELKKIGLEIINKAVKEDKLTKVENIYNILYRWREWAGEEPPQKYVENAINSQEGVINFLQQTLSASYESRSDSYDVIKNEYFDFKGLSHFVSVEVLKDKVSEITENEESKNVLGIFSESYNKWLESQTIE